MRILSYRAENFLNLKLVELTPDGRLTTFTGPNGSGKSANFAAMYCALTGSRHLPDVPIRLGAKKATVKLGLGDREVELTVVLRVTASGPSLTVEAPDGSKFSSPTTLLQQLVGQIAFDPSAFTRMKPAERLELLRKLVPLDIDVKALDLAYDRDFKLRTEWNHRIKSFEERLAAIDETIHRDADVTLIDVSALIEQMATAGEHNAGIERERSARAERARKAAALNDEAHARWVRARELRIQADALDTEANALAQESFALIAVAEHEPALPPLVDVSDLRVQIAEGQQSNFVKEQELRQRDQRKVAARELAEAKAKSEGLTNQLESYINGKESAMARAQMPVEGLGFGDGDVTYDGLPFEQVSTGQGMRISALIGMDLNPKLRVLCIPSADLMDRAARAAVMEVAEERDYQVFMEFTQDDAGPMGIHFVDGAVAAINGVPVEECESPDPSTLVDTADADPTGTSVGGRAFPAEARHG